MLLILHCLNAECDISGTLEIHRKPFSMWQIGSKCKCSATTTPANHPGITRHVKNTVYTSASWIAISLCGAPFFWLILTWTLHVVHFKTAEGAVSRLWRASVLNIFRAIFYMTWFSQKAGLKVGWGGWNEETILTNTLPHPQRGIWSTELWGMQSKTWILKDLDLQGNTKGHTYLSQRNVFGFSTRLWKQGFCSVHLYTFAPLAIYHLNTQ